VPAGGVAVGGIAGELLIRAGIAVVWASGGASGRGIAGLASADPAVAAEGMAIGIVGGGAAGRAAAVVIAAGGERLVLAGAGASGHRSRRQVDRAGFAVIAGVGAASRHAGRDRPVASLARFDHAVAADHRTVGIVGGGAAGRAATVAADAAGDRDGDAAGRTGGGRAPQRDRCARSRRGAGGRAGVATGGVVAGLDRAFDDAVAADGGAIRIDREIAARGAAAVAGGKRGHPQMHAGRVAGPRREQQVVGAGIAIATGDRAGAGQPGGDRRVAALARLNDAVTAAGRAVGIGRGGATGRAARVALG